MIKRILLKGNTTDISAIFPTNSKEESVTVSTKSLIDEKTGLTETIYTRNIYLDVAGNETNVSQIPTFKSEYIKALIKNINTLTDKKLKDGVIWNNVTFCLDKEHLDDYRDTVTFLKQGVLQYPYTIKGQNNQYVELTAENVDSFFTTGLTYKETTYQEGWTITNTLTDKTELELINFVDPRN